MELGKYNRIFKMINLSVYVNQTIKCATNGIVMLMIIVIACSIRTTEGKVPALIIIHLFAYNYTYIIF